MNVRFEEALNVGPLKNKYKKLSHLITHKSNSILQALL